MMMGGFTFAVPNDLGILIVQGMILDFVNLH